MIIRCPLPVKRDKGIGNARDGSRKKRENTHKREKNTQKHTKERSAADAENPITTQIPQYHLCPRLTDEMEDDIEDEDNDTICDSRGQVEGRAMTQPVTAGGG